MNFDYLHGISELDKLGANCREAEQLVFENPGMSLIASRKAMEFMVRFLYRESGIDDFTSPTVYEMLTSAQMNDYVNDPAFIEQLQSIRRKGNAAAHGEETSATDAMQALETLYEAVGRFCQGYHWIESYPAFRRPRPDKLGKAIRRIHPDNYRLKLAPYLQNSGHPEWLEMLLVARIRTISELRSLPETLETDDFLGFLKQFEFSQQEKVFRILEAMPLGIATESVWENRRENINPDDVRVIENWLHASGEINGMRYSLYTQKLGKYGNAYLCLVHPELMPQSLKEKCVCSEAPEAEDTFIPLPEAVRMLIVQYVSQHEKTAHLLSIPDWCYGKFGIRNAVLRTRIGEVDPKLYSTERANFGDKRFYYFTAWDQPSLYRLRQLTGEFGEKIITFERMRAWGFSFGNESVSKTDEISIDVGKAPMKTESETTILTITSAEIEKNAYYGNKEISKVVVEQGCEIIGDGAFANSTLRSIDLPSGLREIGKYAFSGLLHLESITIPEGVRRLGAMAFSGSNSLRSIRLPSTLEEIGAMPFYGCEGLRRMEMPKETYERFSEIFTDLAGVECSVVNRNASQDTVNEKNCQEMHMKQQYRLCP